MKTTKRNAPKRRGFTLVELLAVVVILGVLVALLVPTFNSYIARAQGAACASNMRQLATALLAYRGEHNGWFPPGYPVAPQKIEGAGGNVLNPGPDGANFNSTLVPGYLDELPICPAARLSPDWLEKYPNYFQTGGGTYGINLILLQWKVEAMPPPTWTSPQFSYSPSRMAFLLETGIGSVTWAQIHQRQALSGVVGGKPRTMGRNHGRGDTLNFMFLDGHIEAISRNDPRDVEDDKKSWLFPTNPNGKFQIGGQNGALIYSSRFNNAQFAEVYPNSQPNH